MGHTLEGVVLAGHGLEEGLGALGVGLDRVLTRLPVRWATLSSVRVRVLEALHQTNGLIDIAPDLLVVDSDGTDGTRRIDDEGGAERRRVVAHGRVVGQDSVIRRDLLRDVGHQREVDRSAEPAILLRRLGPRQVHVVRISRRSQHLYALGLELSSLLREREDLGRADERKVERIKEEHHPLPGLGVLGERDLLELLTDHRLGLEIRRLVADHEARGRGRKCEERQELHHRW
mmetsp:Transcript_17736/g.32312  ORF Transcript_17736/g.32312 Transcript_17736/m.32312 type:complete len:232 (+) Transcript_17736:257-952(+)